MKTLILATTLAALSFTTIAEDKPIDKAASCKKISELAGRYMDLRQSGVPMADIYHTANEDNLIQLMIEQAYEVGRYNTKKYSDAEIVKFKNGWFLSCIKSK